MSIDGAAPPALERLRDVRQLAFLAVEAATDGDSELASDVLRRCPR